jgi:hypothetical protein
MTLNLLPLAIALTQQADYGLSNELLSRVTVTPQNQATVSFYRAANFYALNDRQKALYHAQQVVDSFHPVARYSTVAWRMIDEAQRWSTGDLADIGRDMRVSGDRLARAVGDPETRRVQQEVIDKLDRLIKEMETPPVNPSPSDPVEPPQQPSEAPGEVAGRGVVEDKRLKKMAEQWGTLPPKERARAIQEMSKELPPKFRPMIEAYFQSINKGAAP